MSIRWLLVLGAALVGAALFTDCSSPSYKGLEETPDASGQACSNGVVDGTESDVDCGGSCMTRCATGKKCNTPSDCANMTCSGGLCATPSCTDGVKNGTETDKDCGGDACPKCGVGLGCKQGSDCADLSCSAGGICLAATCSDGIQNQGEKFVDCAGPCTLCADGSPCVDAGECESGVCNGTCRGANCTDGVKNGAETGADCGGGTCPKCAVGGGCTDGARDCVNGVCNNSICQAAHCTDLVKNGSETDTDCGGPDCVGCATGLACGIGTDCASLVCTGAVCQAPSCNPADMQKNGNETDVDCGGGGLVSDGCGGGTCNVKCGTDKTCRVGCDCVSGVCQATPGPGLTCQAASCTDKTRNQDETDADCGGTTCTTRCDAGKACIVAGDCTTGVCRGGICQLPTCQDVTKNGVESDIDCGGGATNCAVADGPCARCDVSRSCNCGADCQSGVCGVNNSCPAPPCTCQAPSCPDTVKNQNETDTDCGGSNNCIRCANLLKCAVGTDCANKVCGVGTNPLGNNCAVPPCQCQAPVCTDGVQNGGETDVDCGGTTCVAASKKCAVGYKCSSGTDCVAPGNCQNGVCSSASASACSNMIKEMCETDLDCGGCCGPTCTTGQTCSTANTPPTPSADCVSGVCATVPGPGLTCQPATCSDGVKNGSETDVDCGGSCSTKCADGKKCGSGTDCQSKVCAGGVCQVPTCPDGQQNGSETDVDCGKGSCTVGCCATQCGNGQKCTLASDCVSAVCGVNNSCPSPPCTCQPPSCSDTVKNQNESDVDCGGICGSTCAEGRSCNGNADCSTVNCQSGTCGPFLCNGPGDFTYGGSHCYHFFATYATWQAALASCQSWGGSLATINSQAENDYLWNNYVKSVSYTWIGLNDIDIEGTFVWANGNQVVYTHWYGGSPPVVNDAEDCIIMTAWKNDNGTWTDLPCSSSTSAYYMCERGGTQVASVTFLQQDTTTQGSWKGVYGQDGYNVINNAASYPAYAQVAPFGESLYTWASSTTDVRGLQKADPAVDRIAACWYASTSFSVDVNLTDGLTHRVAVYNLDWSNQARAQTVEVRDSELGVLLDTRTVSAFTAGVWLSWNIRGHVSINFIHTGGPNAVVSGIFFGP